MTVNDITKEIDKVTAAEDLRYLQNYAFKRLCNLRDIDIRKASFGFVVGDEAKLKIEHCKGKSAYLRGIIGKVVKVNSKTVKVLFNSITWTLTSTMIEKV